MTNDQVENTSAVADPGFPRGGGATPKKRGGRQPIFWPIFPENCMKMKNFWAGGRKGRAPLRSATDQDDPDMSQVNFPQKIEITGSAGTG